MLKKNSIPFAFFLVMVFWCHPPLQAQLVDEKNIIVALFRLRNEHNAVAAGHFFADTVAVYMKNLRNVPKAVVVNSDKTFWKNHPRNRFQITAPIIIETKKEYTKATIYGNEYLDGLHFQKERIEIRLNGQQKIYYYRGFLIR
jgi:hypothetical protein